MVRGILAALIAFIVLCGSGTLRAAPVVGTTGNDILFFQGSLQTLSTTVTNAYTGETVAINGPYNVNTTTYDGLGGFDILVLTTDPDYLVIDDFASPPTIASVEVISAGEGNDVVNLTSTAITFGAMTVTGGEGNDIVWTNAGHDTVTGVEGNDIINAGPGNDDARGGDDNDDVNGGPGADFVRGENGDDTLRYSVDGTYSAGSTLTNAGTPGSSDPGLVADVSGKNRSFDRFDGGLGTDTLVLTDGDDVLRLTDSDSPSHPLVTSSLRLVGVERIEAGDGMDVIDLTNQAMSYYSDMSYPSGIVIDAGSGDDTVWTSGGADTVFAGPGNDVIWTGGGDDAAFGGLDDDLYVIGIGDGMDTIEEEGGFDTISLIGLTIGDLTILAIGLDLEIGTGSGKVTVLGQFLDIAHRVEQLLFEDGSTYDLTMIAPATVPVPGAVWLFASALAGLGATAWRKRRFV